MYVLWIMLAYLVLLVVAIVRGPSIWDRLLGLNLVSVKVIIITVVFASVNDTIYLLDFAIIYALSGFIGTIFIALFISERKRRKDNWKL